MRFRGSLAALAIAVANVAVIQLTAGPAAAATVTFWKQDFNAVTAPALPDGWTTACVSCQPGDFAWRTFNHSGTVVDNEVIARPTTHVTDNRLESAPFTYPVGATLSFDHFWKFAQTTKTRPDGGVVEFEVGTGAWTDIIAAGGSFAGSSGSYIGPISSPTNPLNGRNAYIGGNGDLTVTTITLPASQAGQTVRVRWRLASDNNGVGDDGTSFWTIDNVRLTGPASAAQTISFTSTVPANPAVGDTYTPAATATSGLPVTLSIAAASSAVCSIDAANVVTFNATGSCVIQADQAGSASFAAAPQGTQTVNVRGNQTISFTSNAPSNAHVGDSYTPAATATSGLTVSFSIASGSAAVCSIAGGVVTFNATGSCVIQADQAGNASFNPAPQVTQSGNAGLANQTISFTSNAPSNPQVRATYTPTATASSGLPVTFSIASASTSVCSIAGGVVTFNATGSCVIQADQSGNVGFNAAPQVTQSATVVKADQTISFTSPASDANPGDGHTLTATATSGLPVTFSIASGSTSVCSIVGTVLYFNATGSCVVHADQAGNASFNAAPQATQTSNVVPVGKTDQTISFTSNVPSNAHVGDTYTPAATATSGLPVTFTVASASSTVCSVDAANLVTINFNGVGSCVIQADQGGSASFAAAPQVTQSVTVAAALPSNQTISFTSTAPINPPVGATYTPTATATVLPVTFSIAASSSAVCSIDAANLVTFNATGSCVIQADQAGNGSFNPAPQVTQSVTVVAAAGKTDQTISFSSAAPANAHVGDTYTPAATATSGLPVTFSIASSSSAVCSIGAANLVTFNGVGSCVVQADQAGNASFNAAPRVTQTATVVAAAPVGQTISFSSAAPANAHVGDTYTPAATATSGLPVTFSIAGSSSAVCSIGAANLVTFNATGSCVIQADQAGNASFNAAPRVTQSATVVAPPPAAVNKAWITSFATSSLRNDFSGWVGSRLVVGPADVSVTALGRWVVAGNGGTHAVRLVNAAGADVATATVDTAGAPAGTFKYAPLASPVTLTAGGTYYLLSQENAGGDSWYEYNLSVTTTAVASDTGAAWTTNASPAAVTAGGSPGQSYGPSNFLYASLAPPAPAGTALVSSFTPTRVRNDFSGWVGMRMTVGSSNLSVSALGRWAVGADTGTHTVRLVNAATGAEVASVAVDMNGAPAGAYVYASLATPVTLTANTTYYLVSQETAGGDRWYDYDTHTVTTSAGTDIGVAYSTADTPNSFVVGGGLGQSYGPPNLIYVP